MHNKTICKQADIGVQFAHPLRGHAICCASSKRVKNISPKEFWDSNFLKKIKDDLKNNIKIDNCQTCWHAESKKSISFRQTYNTQFKNLTPNELPQAIDLDLSNFCNLKCIMCDSSRSSSWAKELGKNIENNGVIETEKKHFEEICNLSYNLKYLTIQGGEPSLIKMYRDYFDFLKKNNIINNVILNVVTNLTNINNKFFSSLEYFKEVNINVSIDSYNMANNYIRFPSNFSVIEKNLKLLNKKFNVGIHVALGTLAMFNIKDFLKWIEEMQLFYNRYNRNLSVHLQRVWTPILLDINYAPKKLKIKFLDDIDSFFMENHKIKNALKFNLELHSLKKNLLLTEQDRSTELKKYIQELDTRRNIKVTNYIPNFYDYF